MDQTAATPRTNAEILKGMRFKQITGDAGHKPSLFLRKEESGGEPTVSLASSSTGTILTIESVDWESFCEEIRAGRIT